MDSRNVSTTIALTEVPFVMRAMGFYPSEQEVGYLSQTLLFITINFWFVFVFLKFKQSSSLKHFYIVLLL